MKKKCNFPDGRLKLILLGTFHFHNFSNFGKACLTTLCYTTGDYQDVFWNRRVILLYVWIHLQTLKRVFIASNERERNLKCTWLPYAARQRFAFTQTTLSETKNTIFSFSLSEHLTSSFQLLGRESVILTKNLFIETITL